MFARSRSPLLELADDTSDAAPILVAVVAAESLNHRHMVALANETTALLVEETTHLVLDLSNVGYIDSAGLGGLVRAVKMARDSGREMGLCCLHADVRVLIELMRLHELIDVFNTVDEARAAYSPSPQQQVEIDVRATGIDVGDLLEEAVTVSRPTSAIRQPSSIGEIEALR